MLHTTKILSNLESTFHPSFVCLEMIDLASDYFL